MKLQAKSVRVAAANCHHAPQTKFVATRAGAEISTLTIPIAAAVDAAAIPVSESNVGEVSVVAVVAVLAAAATIKTVLSVPPDASANASIHNRIHATVENAIQNATSTRAKSVKVADVCAQDAATVAAAVKAVVSTSSTTSTIAVHATTVVIPRVVRLVCEAFVVADTTAPMT